MLYSSITMDKRSARPGFFDYTERAPRFVNA
jgi:hypothetical protein